MEIVIVTRSQGVSFIKLQTVPQHVESGIRICVAIEHISRLYRSLLKEKGGCFFSQRSHDVKSLLVQAGALFVMWKKQIRADFSKVEADKIISDTMKLSKGISA